MTWSSESLFAHFRICEALARETPVVCTYASCYAFVCVYCYCVGGPVGVAVGVDHLREFQLCSKRGEDWGAEVTRGIPDHEGGFGGSEV